MFEWVWAEVLGEEAGLMWETVSLDSGVWFENSRLNALLLSLVTQDTLPNATSPRH